MALWGKTDVASNVTAFAASYVKLTPNTANRDSLYGNTTVNAFINGVTIGQFAVDKNEMAASGGSIAHTGWVLRTVGSGGRAGRVQTEVLAALDITADNNADDSVYPDYVLFFSSQPVSNSTATANSVVTLTAAAGSIPTGAPITYQWFESANGVTYVAAITSASGGNTDTLTITNNSAVNGFFYLVEASAAGANSIDSDVVTITVAA